MSAGDYRKPEGKPGKSNVELWFNWLGYEMAARLGYVERTGVSTVTAESLDMTKQTENNKGPYDIEALFDEFFDKFDELDSK